MRLSILRGQIIHRAAVHADGTSRHIFDLFLREVRDCSPTFRKTKSGHLSYAFIAVAGIVHAGVPSVKKFE